MKMARGPDPSKQVVTTGAMAWVMTAENIAVAVIAILKGRKNRFGTLFTKVMGRNIVITAVAAAMIVRFILVAELSVVRKGCPFT